MKHRRWFKALALVAVLSRSSRRRVPAMTTAATAANGGDVDCATVEFGCVEVGADEPINLGAAQVISGADATLGQDQVNALELAIDYLDGDVRPDRRHAARPPGRSSRSRTSCARPKAGRRRGTALAADASIVAVIGTSCSSAALGVADTILGDKGITAVLRVEHEPGADGSGAAQPVLRPHRAQRPDPGRDRRRVRARRRRSAPRRRRRSPTRARTPRDSSARSRRTSRPAAARSRARSRSTRRTPTSSRSSGRWPKQDPDVLYFPIFVAACTLIIKQAQDIMPDADADRGRRVPVERHAEERGAGSGRRLGILAGPVGVPDERVLLGRVHPRVPGGVRERTALGVPRALLRRRERRVRGDRGGRDRQRRRIALDPAAGAPRRDLRDERLRGRDGHDHVPRHG